MTAGHAPRPPVRAVGVTPGAPVGTATRASARTGAGAGRTWLELAGLATASSLAVLAVWRIASTARAWMLYYDGDSVLFALVRSSLAAGQAQHWSLSAVLFLPEGALYAAITALGFGVKASFALNAVLNFVLLYGALRWAAALAGPRAQPARQVAGALLALATFVMLTLFDTSPAWDNAELPSLLATTTYYSATVLGLVVTPGLAVRAATTSGRGPLVGLVAVDAVSTLTNPLYLGWVGVPLVIVCLLLAGRELIDWRPFLRIGGAVVLGAALGLAGRLPFAGLISRDTAGYANPSQAAHVFFGFYLRVVFERVGTPLGALSVIAALGLIALSVVLLIHAVRRRMVPLALLAGFGCVTPVVVTIGAIALGTHAFRYLQPVYIAPLVPLVLLPGIWVRARPRSDASGRSVATTAALTTVSLGVALVGVGGISDSVHRVDSSIRCLDSWITASHRTGAGRFLTVRGPKAYLPDPRQLVQVDSTFREFLWLVNRDDYARKTVSFVVSDTATDSPELPLVTAGSPRSIRCGRYTITDYGQAVLPIGPPSPDSLP